MTSTFMQRFPAQLVSRTIVVSRLAGEYDFVKVLDFGLVKLGGPPDADRVHLAADGETSGTPAYMTPEIAVGEAPPDRRADLYSLGCVADWLVTGELVFTGKNVVRMIFEHVRDRPASEVLLSREAQPVRMRVLR